MTSVLVRKTIASLTFLATTTLLTPLCPAQDRTPTTPKKEIAPPPRLPAIRDMVQRETVSFVAPPPLIVEGRHKCDGEGNIFVVYSNAPQAVMLSGGTGVLPIKKLVIDSRKVIEFNLNNAQISSHLR